MHLVVIHTLFQNKTIKDIASEMNATVVHRIFSGKPGCVIHSNHEPLYDSTIGKWQDSKKIVA